MMQAKATVQLEPQSRLIVVQALRYGTGPGPMLPGRMPVILVARDAGARRGAQGPAMPRGLCHFPTPVYVPPPPVAVYQAPVAVYRRRGPLWRRLQRCLGPARCFQSTGITGATGRMAAMAGMMAGAMK